MLIFLCVHRRVFILSDAITAHNKRIHELGIVVDQARRAGARLRLSRYKELLPHATLLKEKKARFDPTRNREVAKAFFELFSGAASELLPKAAVAAATVLAEMPRKRGRPTKLSRKQEEASLTERGRRVAELLKRGQLEEAASAAEAARESHSPIEARLESRIIEALLREENDSRALQMLAAGCSATSEQCRRLLRALCTRQRDSEQAWQLYLIMRARGILPDRAGLKHFFVLCREYSHHAERAADIVRDLLKAGQELPSKSLETAVLGLAHEGKVDFAWNLLLEATSRSPGCCSNLTSLLRELLIVHTLRFGAPAAVKAAVDALRRGLPLEALKQVRLRRLPDISAEISALRECIPILQRALQQYERHLGKK